MAVRGELFTTQVVLDNRSYFFNVKENRTGDVFLQVVESKNKNGEEFDRHAIVVFADDMQKFFKGLESSLSFIEKDRKEKAAAKKSVQATPKKRAPRQNSEEEYYQAPSLESRNIKKTGRIRVVSKRNSNNNN